MNYRIVVDTNVLLSAVLNKQGKPAAIIDAVISGEYTLISSYAIMEEVRRVFAYPKIQSLLRKNRISPQEIQSYIDAISRIAIIVPGKLEITAIQNDLSDNMFLSCAIEGTADFIISGDHHLSDLIKFRNIPILNPAEFIDHAYFHTPEWQAGEAEADQDIDKGNIKGPFKTVEEALKGL
jgi:uncharacterized protein